LSVTKTLRAEISDKSNVLPAAIGLRCPQIIFPNSNGVGYFRSILGAASEKLLTGVSKIQDENLQIMVWSALWQEVQDARLSFARYGNALATALVNEKRGDLLEIHFARLLRVFEFYYYGDLQKTEAFQNLVRKVEATTWSRFLKAEPALKKFWFEWLIFTSESPDRLNLLARIYNGRVKTPGFRVDSDLRWNIVAVLAGHDFKDVRSLIEQGRKKDTSFNGKVGAITGEASLPEWSVKAKWIEEFKQEKSDYTYVELRAVVHSLFPPLQKQLRKQYQDQFFVDLLAMQGRKDSRAQATFVSLSPFSCENDSLVLADEFLKKHPDLNPSASKGLRERADESTRCYKIVHAAF
jgi:aminopeptidase N